MTKTIRTQAMRMLDARKIPYTAYLFSDSIHDAQEVAAALGLPASRVFKTLVLLVEGDLKRPLLVMLPANQEIDLRQLARELEVKSVQMASYVQAEKLTGLKVGGISALALLNRPYPVYLDIHARAFESILVSGGQRGVDLELSVEDLRQVTQASYVQATRIQAE